MTAAGEKLLAGAIDIDSEKSRHRFFGAHPETVNVGFVELLCREAARLTPVSRERAERIVETIVWLAGALGEDRAHGLSLRARANLQLYTRDYRSALASYEASVDRFERAGDGLGAAITRSVGLGALAQLGQYRRAREWAALAREELERRGDRLRIARLDFNIGSICSRQDRFHEALTHFRAAYEVLRTAGKPRDVGGALRNLAVCYQDLNDIPLALETYEKARVYCRRNRLAVLELEVNYNIAYLHFMRGEYTRALSEFDVARRRCEETGDRHHSALCDLEKAEIYLELNLVDEATQLAARAFEGFSVLGMEYETAKALRLQAMAADRRGRPAVALELLAEARSRFEEQENRIWVALVDLHRASILAREQRIDDAYRLAREAFEGFSVEGLPTRMAACEVLLARLALARGERTEAKTLCRAVLGRARGVGMPALEFQALLLTGQVEEEIGNLEAALASYRRAERSLEGLRTHVATDELKVAFTCDKQAVHEALVSLMLDDEPSEEVLETVFATIERARSRALADLLAFRSAERAPAARVGGGAGEELAAIRRELNWSYRRLDEEELKGRGRSADRVKTLQQQIRRSERRLQQSHRRQNVADWAPGSPEQAEVADLETLRRSLPEGSVLLEFFVARDCVFGCLVTGAELEIRPLTAVSSVERHLHQLRFELGKFQAGGESVRRFGELAARSTRAILSRLYEQLVAPFRPQLECEHLVLVPHGLLHQLPLHALLDGERFLLDEFTISYAPSATVFQHCSTRKGAPEDWALVIGVPDRRAPLLEKEAREVAEVLPGSRLLLREEATRESLVEHGRRCRILHLATHGHFRRDNPMFSSIQLSDARLSLYDLYDLRLNADLVVLSGCSTGLAAVEGGDELVGLIRGLLYAGARSLMATLWDVSDDSTAKLMRSFYRGLLESADPASELRRAQRELRESYPHPYYWAPFVLQGWPGRLGSFDRRKSGETPR